MGFIVLQNGDTFKATIEAGQSSYSGSEQNGVTSRSYNAYWFGSYRLSAAQTQSGAQQPTNFTLSYDAAGNITQKGDLVLSYNDRNRVARAEKTGMQAIYRYNAEGLRSSKTVNGQRTDYIYGMGGALLAWKDNSCWHENIYLDGDIIAVVESGKVYYTETDYQGKALRLLDNQGQTVWQSDWLPYRESDSQRNGINYLQRFAGQMLDEETGLYYNHYREYDPQTGRYTQSDPIGLKGGINTYAYVGGNPIMRIDPLGLEAATSCAVGGALGGTLAGGACVGGGVVTAGGTTIASPYCAAAGAAAGCAVGAAVDTAVDACVTGAGYLWNGTKNVWNSMFNKSGDDSSVDASNDNQGSSDSSDEEERYADSGKKRAPTQSSPYNTHNRYNEDGSLRQTTTYDQFGRRHRQYDMNDGRRPPHQHNFDEYGPNQPNGVRSDHLPIDE